MLQVRQLQAVDHIGRCCQQWLGRAAVWLNPHALRPSKARRLREVHAVQVQRDSVRQRDYIRLRLGCRKSRLMQVHALARGHCQDAVEHILGPPCPLQADEPAVLLSDSQHLFLRRLLPTTSFSSEVVVGAGGDTANFLLATHLFEEEDNLHWQAARHFLTSPSHGIVTFRPG